MMCTWFALFMWVLMSFQAGAQVQLHLDGRVTDATTAVLPGAKVTVRNLDTGVALTAVSNESGGYVFPTLLPGDYELRCEAAGFKWFLQTGVGLETGQATTIDIQLEVGVVSETVQVKASPPLLETGNATLGQFIERSMVQNIPLDTRRTSSIADHFPVPRLE